MTVKVDTKNDTEALIQIVADKSDLKRIREKTLKKLRPDVSAPGFRKGKAPLDVVAKQVDDSYFKSQYLDEALNDLFVLAVKEHKLRPVSRPQVEMKKFVPFDELEFEVKVEIVPTVKLPDYTKHKVERETTTVTDTDIKQVIENLRTRMAEKKDVETAAKEGDEIWIDFAGLDSAGKPVAGAKGDNYPLVIGSDTFIKGFEPKLIGMKKGEKKTFTLSFPDTYAHTPLAGKKVTFSVSVNQVKSVDKPGVTDDFAKKVGQFKTVSELKDDIKKQLEQQKGQEAVDKFKDKVVEQVVVNSELKLPGSLVEEQIEGLLAEFKQNLVYRGMTYDEYLDQAGIDETTFKQKELRPKAERQVKTGLVLAEVADKERLSVTPEEIEIRTQILKGQYKDEQMQRELDSEEAHRRIASNLLTEKTVDKLAQYAKK